jgi:syntaxin 5
LSRDIANTSTLLSELTQAVRQKSIFQDEATVNRLVVRIKTSVENLHARLESAERTLKRSKQTQAGQEATNLVHTLQSEFAATASGFQKVLQQRTENLKENVTMQQQMYDMTNDDDMPDMSLPPQPVNLPTLDLTSNLMMAAGEPTGGPNTPYNYYPSHGAPLTPLDMQRLDEEQGLLSQQLIPPDYLRARADAMTTVETNIVELGTIFQKLAGLVQEHKEMVQRVEDNVEEANATIFQSMNVLTDTLDSLRSNRSLVLRVFSVLVLFIIMFIIFAA